MKGNGNQQDYGMRIYDPRLGRFLSLDPLQAKYPELTPYQFASNTPIQAIDLDGLEQLHFTRIKNADGTVALKQGQKVDFSEWSWSEFKFVKNPRVEYVVHQTDSKLINLHAGTTRRVTYDETVTYNSYSEALKSSDGDFNGTSADFWNTTVPIAINGTADASLEGNYYKHGFENGNTQKKQTSTTASSAHGGVTLTSSSGTAKPPLTGAPNSIYTQIGGKNRALANYIYDSNGNLSYSVDFKNHGSGYESGHGHKLNGSYEHLTHDAPGDVPANYKLIPEGLEHKQPIGQ